MKALRYAKRLIGFDSTSHKSNRMISRYLEMKLTKHGFIVERVEYLDGNDELKVNLIAKKGSGDGGLGTLAIRMSCPRKNGSPVSLTASNLQSPVNVCTDAAVAI